MQPMMKVDLVRAACCVAGASGTTSDEERRIIQLLADDVGIGKASLDAIIDRAESDPQFYREQFRFLQGNSTEMLKVLFSVALIDGSLLDEERDVLQKLAKQLHMQDDEFQTLLEEATAFASTSTPV